MDQSGSSIRSLSTDTVRLITAGEIYSQGVVNVVKELVENSIDAQATNVTVQWEKGGYLNLSVADDGLGIRSEDVTMLCRHHTTSKIRCFEDVSSLTTFGFRGEALNCLSYTATLEVTSFSNEKNSADASGGFTAVFADGEMLSCIEVSRSDVERIAERPSGTSIMVRNLFRKHPTRRRLANIAAETTSIISYLTELSFLYPKVSFNWRNLTSGQCGSLSATDTTFQRICLAHQADHSSPFLPITDHSSLWTYEAVISSIGAGHLQNKASGHTPQTKPRFITCVNRRPVSWPWFRRCFKILYEEFTSKKSSEQLHESQSNSSLPFVFLNLSLPPDFVDVNVDPTKGHILIKDEQMITKQIIDSIRTQLIQSFEPQRSDQTPPSASNSATPAGSVQKRSDGSLLSISHRRASASCDIDSDERTSQRIADDHIAQRTTAAVRTVSQPALFNRTLNELLSQSDPTLLIGFVKFGVIVLDIQGHLSVCDFRSIILRELMSEKQIKTAVLQPPMKLQYLWPAMSAEKIQQIQDTGETTQILPISLDIKNGEIITLPYWICPPRVSYWVRALRNCWSSEASISLGGILFEHEQREFDYGGNLARTGWNEELWELLKRRAGHCRIVPWEESDLLESSSVIKCGLAPNMRSLLKEFERC